ncbi:MAG: Asparagine-tRNA ligase [Candidatus Uhrbacteria bacterium GW2011_GWE2_40_58]|nr:MAG: Asparagine-tRNA ligase [Candidatus Uhrbacteria bacterium GW2011_GWF2_40_263]KKR66878.1 MAG: Asparagine-tRNA ligase [Candidatus Uhrbacteria bacterium GW2011_GWE2_40_58]OGL93826.1 MAG: asparagine--tRNA ligase [Candidatus Uhrbacteria bacterium RIFOXYA2_FULL_40_9]OGL97982.1 MAG: asparagine--tRNA ligase [Candidatus Uhrbacteria bacterium RIFOXYB2_FULL_41_18]HBK35244.1 asparagine--tRNA ligase [Candidatus Uhrbacteria bacterium]
MSYSFVSKIGFSDGKEITLKGWAYNFRCSGKIFFLQFRDGTGRVQIVYSKADIPENQWEALNNLKIESSVIVTGVVKKDDRAPSGYELEGKVFEIIQLAPEDYPISKKEHGPDFLLDHRHLWLRSEKQWAIQRVRDTVIQATYEYLHEQGFIKFDSPILTPNACEGTTELFGIKYFDEGSAYLSQSGQLYLEAGVMSFGRCFDFGPVFRAEKSKTRRHLTEFWMMDAEAAFVEHEENMKIQEGLIMNILTAVLEKNRKELAILERDVQALEAVQAPFIRMTHAEAVERLHELGSDIGTDDDLGADDETLLTSQFDRPVFVEKYPAAVKAFYMKRDPQNSSVALCSDLLASEGYGEIIGGSQREDDYETLLARINEHQLPVEAFNWYLDLRKYGSVPHSGFGYGLERIVGWMCGTHHIRETIPFPRLINRISP